MKKLKKLISSFLGASVMFATMPKTSALIEMWTFNDGTRVSKFEYTDFDYMIAFYEGLVQENEKHLFTKKQNIIVKAVGIGLGVGLLVGSGVIIHNCETSDTSDLLKKITAGVLSFSGISSILASFYPEFVANKVEKDNTSGIAPEKFENNLPLLGLKDIRDLLKNTKQNLEKLKSKGFKDGVSYKDLKKHPYYILVDRPKSVDENHECDAWKSSFYSEYDIYLRERMNVNQKIKEIFANLKGWEKLKVIIKDEIVRLDFNQGRICYYNYEKNK